MIDSYYAIIEYISNPPSGLLIPILLAITAFVGHLYYLILKDRKDIRESENENEQQRKKHEAEQYDKLLERESESKKEIIAVVKENTAAITANTTMCASLKMLFESLSADVKTSLASMSADTKDSLIRVHDSFVRVHERLDEVLDDTRELKVTVKTKNEK